MNNVYRARATLVLLLLCAVGILAACSQDETPEGPVAATEVVAQGLDQVAVTPPSVTPAPYPAETAVLLPPQVETAYPGGTVRVTAVSTPQPAATLPGTEAADVYLPLVAHPEDRATETAVPAATPKPPTATPTPIPTIDVAALQAELALQGLTFVPVKIGFHVGIGGNSAGLETWMRRLDEAGIPFFLKSVDNAQPILFAQELRKQSGVPHVLVYRKASGGDGSFNWDVPRYDLPPAEAAALHWQMHRDAFPPELDRSMVWLETINEVDKNQSEWLGQFAWPQPKWHWLRVSTGPPLAGHPASRSQNSGRHHRCWPSCS